MGSIKLQGLEDLMRELTQLEKTQQVSLSKLFNPSFMKRYTDHPDIEAFFEHSGFKIETQEDLENLPEKELDRYTDSVSHFNSWEEMLTTAASEHLKRELGS